MADPASTADGYAHDPEAFEEGDDRVGGQGQRTGDADPGVDPGEDAGAADPATAERAFDWRGWTLVAAIFVGFLVVPGIIYLYPRVGTTFGLSFWDAYIVLPMVPAILLGILAVWATTRP